MRKGVLDREGDDKLGLDGRMEGCKGEGVEGGGELIGGGKMEVGEGEGECRIEEEKE